MVPVTCYPVLGKQKSVDLCEAFAEGCGGRVVRGATKLLDGPAFFWGVDDTNRALWHEARDGKDRHYYYGDNSYIDSARGEYFRVTFDRLQHRGYGEAAWERFDRLGVPLLPWTDNRSGHIVLCPQSDFFMETIVGQAPGWTERMQNHLGQIAPDREVRLRAWNRDKAKLSRSLPEDLDGAYCLVTWSSAAAITALLHGVPSISAGQSAAKPMEGSFETFFNLPKPDRREWAGVLANNQWTVAEIRSGACWETLRRQRWHLSPA